MCKVLNHWKITSGIFPFLLLFSARSRIKKKSGELESHKYIYLLLQVMKACQMATKVMLQEVLGLFLRSHFYEEKRETLH
jgi:hypothetical protein